MLPNCTCGSLVDVEQIGPKKWLLRCRRCSAFVVREGEQEVSVVWEENLTILQERDDKSLKFTAGEVRECCKDPRNLRFHSAQYDLKTYICAICHRRHLKMLAEPGNLGLIIAEHFQAKQFDVKPWS